MCTILQTFRGLIEGMLRIQCKIKTPLSLSFSFLRESSDMLAVVILQIFLELDMFVIKCILALSSHHQNLLWKIFVWLLSGCTAVKVSFITSLPASLAAGSWAEYKLCLYVSQLRTWTIKWIPQY